MHAGCEVVAYCGRAYRVSKFTQPHGLSEIVRPNKKRGIVEAWVQFLLCMWIVCRQLFNHSFFTRHDHMFVIFRLNVYELSVFCFSVVVCVVCFCCAHFTLDTDSYLFQMTALSNSMEKHTAKFHSIYISRALFNRTLHDLCGWKRKNMYCTFHVRNIFFSELWIYRSVECIETGIYRGRVREREFVCFKTDGHLKYTF